MNADAAAGVALIVGACLAVTVVVLGIRRRERTGGFGRVPPPARAAGAAIETGYDLVLRGGAWVNGYNVSWPMATLRIGRTQAELDVSGIDLIRVSREEVTGVRFLRRPLGVGIRFRSDSGRLDRVTFWSLRPAAKRLRDLGWS